MGGVVIGIWGREYHPELIDRSYLPRRTNKHIEKKKKPLERRILNMGEQGNSPDSQLFQVLGNLLQQVEALTNQEEVELRSKIEALGLEVTKVPSKSSASLNELEIAKELDKLSAKLDHVDEMISSTMADDPQVKSLLSSTADLWMPIITAGSDERRSLAASIEDGNCKTQGKNSD